MADLHSDDAACSLTMRRHSRNLPCAACNWVKELVRCSTSSSSCFLTALSCGALRLSRFTDVGRVGFSQ